MKEPEATGVASGPRRRARGFVPVVIAAALLALAAVVGLAVAVRWGPGFYAPRVGDAAMHREQAAGRLISQAASLVAAVKRVGRWEAAFTDEEINAWLDLDLPRNHPKLLPRGISGPHVRFEARRVQAAARIAWGPLVAISWADLDVALREINQVHVAVERSGLGLLPLPPGIVLREIARGLAPAGLASEMRFVDGRPVLVLYIPAAGDGAGRTSRLEGLRIDAGEAVLEGVTREDRPAG